ncbi:glycosyltransferase family 4 protein [Modestobacter sp. SYSU DS0657]
MRILTHALSLERLGGLEVNTLEATKALLARGHEVHLLHGAPLLGGAGPQLGAEFEAAGAVLHGPFPFGTSLRGAPRAIPRFLPAARLSRELRPDVIWLQRPEQIFWGQTVARVSRTPLVVHLHHVPNYGRALPYLHRGVTRFIAVSEFMRRRWVANGLRPELVDVVHNAVPADTYPPGGAGEQRAARDALGLPDVPTVLYYGRLEEAKGLTVTLDAWEQLAPRAGEAHLLLAGDVPPGEERWAPQLDAAVATGTVTVLPNQGDVVPLLHAADVVVFPTLLEEAFGRVALEALMTHRPVLASDLGAVGEILTGPLARFLLPAGDAAALAGALEGLVHWRTAEPGLGALCGAEAERRFGFDGYVEALERSLGSAAGARGPRRSVSAG